MRKFCNNLALCLAGASKAGNASEDVTQASRSANGAQECRPFVRINCRMWNPKPVEFIESFRPSTELFVVCHERNQARRAVREGHVPIALLKSIFRPKLRPPNRVDKAGRSESIGSEDVFDKNADWLRECIEG